MCIILQTYFYLHLTYYCFVSHYSYCLFSIPPLFPFCLPSLTTFYFLLCFVQDSDIAQEEDRTSVCTHAFCRRRTRLAAAAAGSGLYAFENCTLISCRLYTPAGSMRLCGGLSGRTPAPWGWSSLLGGGGGRQQACLAQKEKGCRGGGGCRHALPVISVSLSQLLLSFIHACWPGLASGMETDFYLYHTHTLSHCTHLLHTHMHTHLGGDL